MSHLLLDSSSRVLTAFMESIVSLPNRPDLRYTPRAARRAGADISSPRMVVLPTSVGLALNQQNDPAIAADPVV